MHGTIGGVTFTGLRRTGRSSRLLFTVRSGISGTTRNRHTLINGCLGLTDAIHNVTSSLVNASDSHISRILNRADDLADTGLLTILRVENTRHCGFDQKHDIPRIRFAITIDEREIASDPSHTQDPHWNREVPSTVRLDTGHVITILVVRTRWIIQASAGEPSDLLPVIHWNETNDLTVIVRLIDHNVRELLTDIVDLDDDGTEQVGCDCHHLPHLEMPA